MSEDKNGKCGAVEGGKGAEEDKDYELVPPEGGWGFVVCLGLTVIFIGATAHLPCLGFIYGEFLENQGDGTGALATVHGVFACVVSCGGFFANIALKRYSLRQVGLFGTFLLTSGGFLGIFVQTTLHLILTTGIIQGCGFGITMTVSYTMYNGYFTVKRVLYLSLCKAGIGMVIMIYPLILKYTMEEYGFRGTLAFLAAVTAHSIPGAIVYHPVSWHMKKKKKVCEKVVVIPPTPAVAEGVQSNVFEFKNIVNKNGTNANVKKDTSKSTENLKPLLDKTNNDEQDKDATKAKTFLIPDVRERRSSTPVVSLGSRRRSSTLRVIDDRFSSNDEIYMQNIMKAVSMSSLGNFGAQPLPLIKNKQGKWQTIVDFLDLGLLKDPIYTNISIGIAFSFFADIMFFGLEPLLLHHYKFDKTQVTNIISVGGAADMVGKLTLGLVGQFYKGINSRYIFYFGSVLPCVIRTVFLQYTAYMPVLVLTGVLGLLRAMLHITQPLTFAAYIPLEKFPAAYGLYNLIFGLVNITVGPTIGYLRDLTGSYSLTFHLISACNLMCVIPWTVEAIICTFKKRNKKQCINPL